LTLFFRALHLRAPDSEIDDPDEIHLGFVNRSVTEPDPDDANRETIDDSSHGQEMHMKTLPISIELS
jgi:hypothetical protein